jgi:hypothetical protein
MDVTVFNSLGRVEFKGAISANATFATRNLDPGDYVVQFNTKSAAVKGNQYLLVVSAGKKKVIAPAVPGETLTGGGAAMKLYVGPGLKITGQIAKDQAMASPGVSKYRVIEGRLYMWVTAELGSHLGGRWVDASLAPAQNLKSWRTDDFRNFQDLAGEGSMLKHAQGDYPRRHY